MKFTSIRDQRSTQLYGQNVFSTELLENEKPQEHTHVFHKYFTGIHQLILSHSRNLSYKRGQK